MDLISSLLRQIFGKEQCSGVTMSATITMVSDTLCSSVERFSSAGGDSTRIKFDPPLPLDEALLHAGKYKSKGFYTHINY